MEIGIKVNGKIIDGDLRGTSKSWTFHSDNEYFIQNFPLHATNSDFFLKLYSNDNPIGDPDKEAIYDELLNAVLFFLDRVPDSFNDNRYNNLFKVANELSVENKIEHIRYVCAPVEKEALKIFKEKYFPDQTRNFKPFYRQEITIYEVKSSQVPYSEEIDYSFSDIYNKSIFAE